jgi:hypothetical protein
MVLIDFCHKIVMSKRKRPNNERRHNVSPLITQTKGLSLILENLEEDHATIKPLTANGQV